MFKKQPLYQAKKDTLMAAIDLINAQSKAMREVLKVIEDSLIEIKQKIQTIEDKARNIDGSDESSKNEREVLYNELCSNIDLQVAMNQYKQYAIKPLIKRLEASKEEILSVAADNSTRYTTLTILDLFSNKTFLIEKNVPIGSLMPSFFSNMYRQMKDKEAKFASTQSAERNIISFRSNSACALVAGLYFITFTGMLAAAVALVACVNPVAGFFILGLAVAFSLYFGNNRLLDQMASLEKHFTEIDEQIQLGTDGQNLFSDLDELVNCASTDSASVRSI